MGLKKLFKPSKEMEGNESKEFLRKNGVVVKDEANYYKKKFKFGEFGKFSEQQAQNQDNTLKPITPNFNTGYGSYDADVNQGDSNQGYGYDEYANDFKGNTSNNGGYGSNTNSYSYSGGYSSGGYRAGPGYNSYSYNEDASNQRSNRPSRPKASSGYSSYSSSAGDQRRPKINNFASSNAAAYGYEPSSSASASASAAVGSSETPSNSYGYEPSINNYSSSNGYGFDPYSDTSITAKSTNRVAPLKRTETSNTAVTQSTYDPYAPGEEPYRTSSGNTESQPKLQSYSSSATGGGYGSYQPDVDYHKNDNNDDNATITGTVSGLATGMEALQLQKEQTQTQTQGAEQEEDFDPYGPSSGYQEQQQEQQYRKQSTVQQNDFDLNEYEPTQEQEVPYDGDEFEEDIDEDEEELNRIQRQTKDVREDTVNLSRTLVDNLGQANVTATNTLGVLGNQREKIYEMENNVGTMKVQQRFVDDHVKDLEHYNRSLFHIKVNNPFTRNSRRRARDQAFLAQRQEDRANKDKLNSDLYQSQRAIMNQLKDDNVKSDLQEKYDYDRRVKEASKYLTKDHDEEDERMEVEIAANVEHAQKLANSLKKKAQLMNNEIDQQNRDLAGVSENVDYMDDKIVMTTRRIRGI